MMYTFNIGLILGFIGFYIVGLISMLFGQPFFPVAWFGAGVGFVMSFLAYIANMNKVVAPTKRKS